MSIQIGNGTINFIKWYTNNTTSIQSNVRFYEGIYYFTDKDTTNSTDEQSGGIVDLWNVYLKEMIG